MFTGNRLPCPFIPAPLPPETDPWTCGTSRPTEVVHNFGCHACGEPASSTDPPDTITYVCNECGQRVANGIVIGRWVVEPAGPGMVQLRVTVGKITHHLPIDAMHAAAVATNILSISVPRT